MPRFFLTPLGTPLFFSPSAWVVLSIFASISISIANPSAAQQSGGNVVAGQATIMRNGNHLTVNQATDRAIINWRSFSIAKDQSAHFALPNASSAVLNRVTGGNPSAIYGSLQSNGQVYLVNPAGIVIGPNANINAASIVASTLDVSNEQFMQGSDLIFQGDSRATIRNDGRVDVSGNIFMIGAHLENNGTLSAPNGVVGLGAGQHVLLADAERPYLVVKATEDSLGGTGIHNKGLIDALQTQLIANGDNVYGLAINNEGIVRSTGVEKRDGRVYLVADGGKIESSGSLIAKRGQEGGDVFIDSGGTPGSSVVVSGTIDVSAVEKGGTIYIKSESIDVGSANLLMDGAEMGSVQYSLGPHSIITTDRGNSGGFLNWNNPPVPLPGGVSTITDSSTLLTLSHSNGALNGSGATVSTVGQVPFIDLKIESADASNPFISGITFNLDRAGGPVSSAATVTFDILVLEPNGTSAIQSLTLNPGSNTKFHFTAVNGELIQSITINSDGGNGLPIFNQFKQASNSNVAAGSIVIKKTTDPDTNALFSFGASYLQTEFQLTNGETKTNNLPVGSYTVGETGIPAGWFLDDVIITSNQIGDTSSYDQNSMLANLDLDAGEVIEVEFVNVQGGKIIVEKQTLPDGSTQSFDFNTDYGSSFALVDNQTNDSGILRPGQYSVEELVPNGWELSDLVITDPNGNSTSLGNAATIQLDPGETVSLVFENTQQGKIIVEKQTLPDGSTQSFDFNTDYGSSFALVDDQTKESGFLSPGQYSVEELVPTGWELSDLVITDPNGNSTSLGNAATIQLDPGETVSLVFENTQQGKIIVEKQTLPDGSTQSFDFNADYTNSFSLSDGQTNESGFLSPGTYSVEELVPFGWTLSDLVITDPNGNSTSRRNSATIRLDPGETVSLLYENTQQGKIIVQKTVPGGSNLRFEFEQNYTDPFTLSDGQSYESGLLAPGTYFVRELVPKGWVLGNINVIDPTGSSIISGNTVTIRLQPGATVRTIFTNQRIVARPLLYRWDPIYPVGIGSGVPYYSPDDERKVDPEQPEMAGGASLESFE